MLRCLILWSAIWTLAGCQPSTVRYEPPPPIPAAKLQPCPPLAELAGGSHNQIELWAVQTVFAYQECADAHLDLIRAVAARQGAKP